MDNIKQKIYDSLISLGRMPIQTFVHILYMIGCILFFIGFYLYKTTSANITILGKIVSIDGLYNSCESNCTFTVEYKLNDEILKVSLFSKDNKIKIGNIIELSYNPSKHRLPVLYTGENNYTIPIILFILTFICFYSGYYLSNVAKNKDNELLMAIEGLYLIGNNVLGSKTIHEIEEYVKPYFK